MVIKQFLIALDQLINTLIKNGFADETISARAFRMTDISKGWNDAHRRIDKIFKFSLNQDNHCYQSYINELRRTQL